MIPTRFNRLGISYSSYQLLEYIETTGTQYINTGLPPDPQGIFEITIKPVVAEYGSNYAGASNGTISLLIGTSGSTNSTSGVVRNYTGSYWGYDIISGVGTSKISYRFEPEGFYYQFVDNSSSATYIECARESGTIEIPVYIGARNYLGEAMFNSRENVLNPCRYYYYRDILDGETRLELRPCQLASGEIGMIDTVTNTFYSNAGTGEFIAGPAL